MMQYHSNIAKDEGLELYTLFCDMCNAGLSAKGPSQEAGSSVRHGTYGNRQVLTIVTNGPFTHVFDFWWIEFFRCIFIVSWRDQHLSLNKSSYFGYKANLAKGQTSHMKQKETIQNFQVKNGLVPVTDAQVPFLCFAVRPVSCYLGIGCYRYCDTHVSCYLL